MINRKVFERGLMAITLMVAAGCDGPTGTNLWTEPNPDSTVASLRIEPEEARLTAVGATLQLSLTALDADGESISDCGTVWSSLSPSVVTVDSMGFITSKAVGAALITALCGGAADTVNVAVSQEVDAVGISPGSAVINVDQTVQLSAVAEDANGNLVSGATYVWTSSDTTIATVDSTGLVRGVTSGNTAITAFSAGRSGVGELSVDAPVSGAALAFDDGFESGSKRSDLDGYGWNGGPSVTDDIARSGSYSLEFDYPGEPDPCQDSSREQRFALGEDLAEVWFEYYIYFPDGSEGLGAKFQHRTPVCAAKNDPNGTHSNNKFFALWDIQYEPKDTKVLIEYRASDLAQDGDSRVYGMWCSDTRSCSDWNWLDGAWNPAITDDLRGRWVQIRIHVRAADSKEAENGMLQVWADGQLRIDMQNIPLAPEIGGNRFFRNGYLMGWANSGFSDATSVYLDDFKIFRSHPDW